jgi:hypothetical protein
MPCSGFQAAATAAAQMLRHSAHGQIVVPAMGQGQRQIANKLSPSLAALALEKKHKCPLCLPAL